MELVGRAVDPCAGQYARPRTPATDGEGQVYGIAFNAVGIGIRVEYNVEVRWIRSWVDGHRDDVDIDPSVGIGHRQNVIRVAGGRNHGIGRLTAEARRVGRPRYAVVATAAVDTGTPAKNKTIALAHLGGRRPGICRERLSCPAIECADAQRNRKQKTSQ